MSTNSAIAMKQEDGSIKSVYCHWDGYPSNQYPILVNGYGTTEFVDELIKLGNISNLEYSVDSTIFYGRDRHEDDQEPESYNDIAELMDSSLSAEYYYYFTGQKWNVFDGNGNDITKQCELGNFDEDE